MKKAAVLITIVSLTVLGLVVLQVNWLQKTITLSEEEFDSTVDKVVLPKVAFEYIRNASILDASNDEMAEALERIKLGEEVRLPVARLEERLKATQKILDSLFKSHGIDTRVVFGVYDYGTADFSMLSDSLYSEDLLNSPYSDCFSCAVSVDLPANRDSSGRVEWLERLDARRSLEDILNDPNYDLSSLQIISVHFPEKSPAILAQISTQLIIAIVLILVLVACFFYTIMIIRRQKQLSEIKKDFVNNLTHELKTPIASILLSTKVLEKSKTASLGPEDAHFVSLIQNEGKRLENHVDRVLQIALIDSGNFSLDKKPVDLHPLLRNVVSSLELIISQRKASINFSLDATDSMMEGDETHLFNLFYNLIENGVKYSEGAPQILVKTTNNSGQIHLIVQDQGIGMNSEVQKHIFERFYRGQSKDDYQEKGFGLGMSYVKSIVDAHKGSISVQSAPGKGSTFTVTFNTNNHE